MDSEAAALPTMTHLPAPPTLIPLHGSRGAGLHTIGVLQMVLRSSVVSVAMWPLATVTWSYAECRDWP